MSRYNFQIAEPTNIDAVGFRERRRGVEIRDCILILEPSHKKRLALLTRSEMGDTFVEGTVRGTLDVLAIDTSRVSSTKSDQEAMERCNSPRSGNVVASDGQLGTFKRKTPYVVDTSKGRFPANLILVHGANCKCDGTKKVSGASTSYVRGVSVSNKATYGHLPKEQGHFQQGYAGEDGKEEVANWICEPSCPVAMLDRQSGNRMSASAKYGSKEGKSSFWGNSSEEVHYAEGHGDQNGGASRFFKQVQGEEELGQYLITLVRG